MLEVLAVATFFGYIFYLRNYADLRSKSEKEEAAFSKGIELYKSGRFDESFQYFDARVKEKPKSSIAYLYRGLSQKGRNNRTEAFKDIQSGVSLDDDVFRAHLEFGKFYLEENDLQSALVSLNKSVAKAEETSPEPYYWRAQAYLALHMPAEAQADLANEKLIENRIKNAQSGPKKAATPFLDKRLIASMVMAIFTSSLVLFVIKDAESVHLPYLIAVFSAIAIGFVEPHKGWLIALLQAVMVLAGYFLFTTPPETGSRQELENFSLYGAVILTFAASFLGGFMKRALNMQ